MISEEEYEVLKSLGDQWKWIARDSGGNRVGDLFAYSEKPYKSYHMKDWGGRFIRWLSIDNYLFQFIQWEDEEPCGIAELIEEYEYSADHMSHIVNERVKALGKTWSESEEKEMKKDIEWLKEEVLELKSNGNYEANQTEAEKEIGRLQQWAWNNCVDRVYDLINQLDEPETLSEEWIGDSVEYAYYMTPRGTYSSAKAVIDPGKLKGILVPKQELPVIPRFVADWVESRDYYNVYKVLQDLSAPGSPHASKDVRNWIFRNQENVEKFVRAWLDDYEVEEEQKYYLKIGNLYLAEPLGDMTSDIVRMTRDKGVAYQFTDEKSIATHLDKFEGIEAVKVEEMEENDKN